MKKFQALMRLLDCILLTSCLIFQASVLNLLVLKGYTASSPVPYICTLADGVVIAAMFYTMYTACSRIARRQATAPARPHQANNGNGDVNERLNPGGAGDGGRRVEENCDASLCGKLKNIFPMAYVSWIIYGVVLGVKLILLFGSEIPQYLLKEDVLGPSLFKFAIGLTAIVFSLVVAAHKDPPMSELRNSYLNNLCFRVALEILDSASFLSLLLAVESHLVYSYRFEHVIVFLACFNILIPALTLYKLGVTDFGNKMGKLSDTEFYYKIIHLILVDGGSLMIRIYLWSMFNNDTSLFMIKNIYAFANFWRDFHVEFKFPSKCYVGYPEQPPPQTDMEMDTADIGNGAGETGEEDGGSDGLSNLNYVWRRKEGSISTKGIHGSINSGITQNGDISRINENSSMHEILSTDGSLNQSQVSV